MGRRGPTPTPTAVKIRRGITAPSRLNLTEPVPRQRPPAPPADLTPGERKIWRSVMGEAPTGMILAIDGLMLRAFCSAEVERRRALATYRQSGIPGLIAARGDGRRSDAVVTHPILRALSFWSDQTRALGNALGLSPGARANLHVAGERGVADGIMATIGPPPRLRAVAGGRSEDEP